MRRARCAATGTVATAVVAGHSPMASATTMRVGGASPRPGAERRRPAGVGDPDPAQRQVLSVQDGSDPPAYGGVVDLGESEAGGAAGEAFEVPGQRERLPVEHLDRLEHPVADGQAVVGHPDGRGTRLGHQFSVDPGAHGATLGGRREAPIGDQHA